MEVLIIGSIAPIILIYLKTAFAERCTVDSQLFPSPASPATLPPPEFPDFVSAFEGTLLRVGIENLWPQGRESCPYSVNWTTFNARLCGSDPFDLDSFCRTLSTVTSVAAPTPTTPENRSTTDVDKRVQAITTIISKANTGAPSLVRSTQDHGIVPSGTTTSNVPVLSSVRPDSPLYRSPPPPPSSPSLPPSSRMSSLASTVDSSSFAASGALTGSGSDTHVAIGVTCCVAFLVVCIILFVVLFSKHRLCKCRGVRRSVLKIVQRQRSDVQPLSTPSLSHPSTPLQVMYSNPLTTNNNVAETSDVEATGNSLTKRVDGFRSAVDLEIPDDT